MTHNFNLPKKLSLISWRSPFNLPHSKINSIAHGNLTTFNQILALQSIPADQTLSPSIQIQNLILIVRRMEIFNFSSN
jgi:hypothetical protein